ncbi:hypothetical protein PhCBS80983_g05136 [Powellomyces hirtus]|uniref:Uncharacterized protein n=1 Tax=Powellomyces hirtus TaxID=109895 RepID=A0A507DVS6_9FUNG|nr:hypothetical protein PhCBS80983_g05136 [Powellomyces hirtus]
MREASIPSVRRLPGDLLLVNRPVSAIKPHHHHSFMVPFSDKEHQSTDWRGIHSRICMLVVPLRTPVAVLGSEEERAHRETQTRRRQVHLLELTKTEAHKKLYEGEYHLAIPAALQALRFSMQVYGPNSEKLVPAYLLLGESSIGLNQLSQAEDYLSLAKWALMKKSAGKKLQQQQQQQQQQTHPPRHQQSDTGEGGEALVGTGESEKEEDEVLALLNRNFGLLYLKKGKTDDAVRCFALDIYHLSIAKNDPEDLSVTGGYFHLGTVLNTLPNRAVDCHALFDRVAEIWRTALMRPTTSLQLDEAQQAEGIQILTAISTCITTTPAALFAAAKAQHALALLLSRSSSEPKSRAKAAAEKALEMDPGAGVMDPRLTEVANWEVTVT